MKAEYEGGVCPLCGCWVMVGDLLIIQPELGIREHKICRDAQEKPDRYPPLDGPLFG
jgi:hypothetical protein